jgi:hypothetical protein
LLELSAWPWLERLSLVHHRHVSLGDVPGAEWDRVAAAGFDLVFLMGVWQRSAIGRLMARTDPTMLTEYDRALPGWTMADVPGSPYSIRRYEPDDRMGGWRGLDAARAELRARGIGLILDFVPNHTGFDHDWLVTHPERYVLGTLEDYRRAPAEFRPFDTPSDVMFVACGRDPYFPPWRDVAQLNYFNPDTRAAVQSTLAEVAAHCDGLRCDMAMLVLNDVFERTWRPVLGNGSPRPADEFWRGAIGAERSLIYLAEVYWDLQGVLLDQGFDFAYDKGLLDALHRAPSEIAGRVRAVLSARTPDPGRLARFIENHDEPRSAATLAALGPAAATLLATLPGLRFFYDGQTDGWRVKAPVQLGRWLEEPSSDTVRALYDRLLSTASEPIFHDGLWKLLTVWDASDDTFSDLIAYRWRDAAELAVIVVNPGPRVAQGHVRLEEDVPTVTACDFDDRLTGARYRWTRAALLDRGLYVRLDPGQAHAFIVRA